MYAHNADSCLLKLHIEYLVDDIGVEGNNTHTPV